VEGKSLKLRLICVCLILFCCGGCVASKVGKTGKAGASESFLSLPEVRERIVAYHERGQYDKDVERRAKSVAEAVDKSINERVEYPAVVMMVEDVLLSTYEARKEQGFAENPAALTALESHVILSSLPAVAPSLDLFNFLLQRNIPVFLVSYRPESFRVPVMDNLSKAGFSGWKKIFMRPTNYLARSNFSEEVRKGLQRTGFNVVATIGAVPEDISGEFAGKAVLYPNHIYSRR